MTCGANTVACVAATTAERLFRIDKQQESLHYVTDISSEDLYILDPEFNTRLPELLIHSTGSVDQQLSNVGRIDSPNLMLTAASCSR